MTSPILVAGATGGIGQQVVGKLLALETEVRALTRDLERARGLFGERPCLELVAGDVRDPASLSAAVSGARAIICTVGAKAPAGDASPEKIDYEGVRNLVLTAQQAGVARFVLVSSISVTHPENPLNNFGRVLDWKLKGEEALRASGLNYTIIRPDWLSDEPGGKIAFRVGQGDRLSGGRISRSDVAAFCIAALDDISTYHTTFEVTSGDGSPPQRVNDLFAGLQTDRELASDLSD